MIIDVPRYPEAFAFSHLSITVVTPLAAEATLIGRAIGKMKKRANGTKERSEGVNLLLMREKRKEGEKRERK